MIDFTLIKRLRDDAGMSQTQLAKDAGVGQNTISRLESGTVRGTALETLGAIGKQLGFTSTAAFVAHLEGVDPSEAATSAPIQPATWKVIADEVARARAKHPGVNITALMEEVGELAHDLLEDAPGWYAEAAQVACVAIRLMEEGCDLHKPMMVLEVPEHDGMKAAGVGDGIASKGLNLSIVDDPITDRQEAMSPMQRQKMIDWFDNSTICTCRSEHARRVDEVGEGEEEE